MSRHLGQDAVLVEERHDHHLREQPRLVTFRVPGSSLGGRNGCLSTRSPGGKWSRYRDGIHLLLANASEQLFSTEDVEVGQVHVVREALGAQRVLNRLTTPLA
jgi:hypothetical protein